MTTCRDCRRPLTDPVSVAAGRGSHCRRKHRATTARRRALDLPPIEPTAGQLDLDQEQP